MKCVIVTHRLRGGGAERVSQLWIKALCELGLSVTVILLDETASTTVSDETQISISALGSGFLTRAFRLRKILQKINADFVFGFQTYPNLLVCLASLLGSTSKIYLSEHTVPSIYLSNKSFALRVQLSLARLLYRRAQGVIAVSHSVATDLLIRFKISSDKCFVLPNSLSTIGSKKANTVTVENLNIVVPARFSADKRPHFALEIGQALADKVERLKIRWIGDEDGTAVMFPKESPEWFKREAWDDDWMTTLEPGTIVMVTSAVEGFGNIFVDAAAGGFRAVASSTALGVGDSIIPGITGFLAITDSPEAFAMAIMKAARCGKEMGLETWSNRHGLTELKENLSFMLGIK